MNDKKHRHRLFSASLLSLVLALLAVGVALAAGNISNTDKWAWGTQRRLGQLQPGQWRRHGLPRSPGGLRLG